MKMKIELEGKKVVTTEINGHRVVTDQPVQAGGDNSAPSPFELFLASLGTCAGIYVKFFCDQRGISTEGISLEQSLEFSPSGIAAIRIEVLLPESFPEKYREAVVAAAEQCKVKKTIQNPPRFEVTHRLV